MRRITDFLKRGKKQPQLEKAGKLMVAMVKTNTDVIDQKFYIQAPVKNNLLPSIFNCEVVLIKVGRFKIYIVLNERCESFICTDIGIDKNYTYTFEAPIDGIKLFN